MEAKDTWISVNEFSTLDNKARDGRKKGGARLENLVRKSQDLGGFLCLGKKFKFKC